IAGLYPILYFFGSYIILVMLSFLVWSKFFGVYYTSFLTFLAMVLFTPLILNFGKKIAVFWLSNIYAFCAKYAINDIKEMANLNQIFANEIFKKLKEQKDEDSELILLSHSVGTILSISVAANVIRMAKKEKISLKRFKILSLGECIPLVSFQKKCQSFKKDLKLVANTPLVWLDITSPIDGACFPLMDFVKCSNIQAEFSPTYRSARFHKLFTPNTYRKICKNKYLAHFLYLYANEIPGEYDFFNYIGAKGMLETKFKGVS
ncbi:MAG: hypothetical protein K2I63_00160, partial [Helicobacter sp.]|nr:hypothetical protein [Helicobacter sp.]